jgi:glucan biosynthesis protein
MASRGQIQHLVVMPDDVTGGWRVIFDLVAPGEDQIKLQGDLLLGKTVLSETWEYLWLP